MPGVVVDPDECFGFGFCAALLPDVFVLDAAGRAVVQEGVVADVALLRQAAEDCPRGAISIVAARPEP